MTRSIFFLITLPFIVCLCCNSCTQKATVITIEKTDGVYIITGIDTNKYQDVVFLNKCKPSDSTTIINLLKKRGVKITSVTTPTSDSAGSVVKYEEY